MTSIFSYLPLFMISSLPISIQLIYLVFCLLLGFFGINKTMGFWGTFFFSILFTPIIGFIVILVSGKKNDNRKKELSDDKSSKKEKRSKKKESKGEEGEIDSGL